jgi:LPXTG-motif cell wall-anchored protein
VQGPVDEESTPPRQINPDQPAARPVPIRPAPQIPAITAPPPRTETPSAPPRIVRQPIDNQREISPEAREDAPQEVPAQAPLPELEATPQPDNIDSAPVQPAADNSSGNPLIYLGLIALILALAGIFLWRRRSRSDSVPAIEEPQENIAKPAENGAISPPQTKPASAKPAPAFAATPPPPAPSSTPKSAIKLEFIPSRAETTLFNAIIAYRLNIINIGEKPIRDVAVHALVEQAKRDMMQQVPPLEGADLLPLRHNHDLIEPGASQAFEGEFRLPLNTIEPIQVSSRYLFVPVTHFWIGYSEVDGTRFAATRSFLVGEEANPPTAKVAPIRLELGPRKIMAVGQRPLIAA